jgi:diguanylate cyclase (GGDEF)-like protein
VVRLRKQGVFITRKGLHKIVLWNRENMNLIKRLEGKSQLFSTLLSIFFIGIIGWIDYYIPPEISVAIFYLIPISLATWLVGKYTGLLVSLTSAITSLLVNQSVYKYPVHPFVHYWNTIVILAFFLLTNYLLVKLRITLHNLENLARTDALTGLTNRKFFLDTVNNEINKALRHQEPLTLAYVDIDDFKKINDQFGHVVGDRLLCLVADTASNTLRTIDLISRIGGDEFAILLPRTGYESAEIVLHRVQKVLLASMKQQGLAVTFSIGAVTFSDPPHSVNEIIEKADNLMYIAKKKGKNLLQHELSVTLENVS